MNCTITIDVNKKCAECGKPGATGSGICLKCAVKVMSDKLLKSAEAKAARKRIRSSVAKSRAAIT